MSRVAKNPIVIPSGISIDIIDQELTVKSNKLTVKHQIHKMVNVKIEENTLYISSNDVDSQNDAAAGTTRALLNNIIIGVTQGFERKLELIGVGYRAQAQGKILNLTLGFSHPVAYTIPSDITIETPSQTEILIKGFDKQLVTQVAAEIRAYRPPESYKGKGIRYAGEKIVIKETKKK